MHILLAIIGALIFLHGLNTAYFSLTEYNEVANIPNIQPSPQSYLLAGIGGLLLAIAGFCISPFYERVFQKNKAMLSVGVRVSLILILILLGLGLTVLPMQEVVY